VKKLNSLCCTRPTVLAKDIYRIIDKDLQEDTSTGE